MNAYGLATDTGRAADQQFHTLILEATGNELLVGLSASTSAAARWTTFFEFCGGKQARAPVPEHRAPFAAIADADAAAAGQATRSPTEQARLDTGTAIATQAARSTAPGQDIAGRGSGDAVQGAGHTRFHRLARRCRQSDANRSPHDARGYTVNGGLADEAPPRRSAARRRSR